MQLNHLHLHVADLAHSQAKTPDVRLLHARLVEDGLAPSELRSGGEFVFFGRSDPDEHRIEVYWES